MREIMESAENLAEKEEFKSSLISRNITIMGRRTSVRLEPEMWAALREIAKRERCSIHDICTLVSVRKSEDTSLTAGIRVFLMLYFRAATTEDGHARAGHGNFEFMKQRARVSNMPSVPAISKNGRSPFSPPPAHGNKNGQDGSRKSLFV